MTYSQTQLKSLAQQNPKELARLLISPNADTTMLTYGAELLGDVPDEQIVLPTLRQLLKHGHAAVREGAMMGLSSFYMEKRPPQDVMDKLRSMSKSDPSPSNKEFATTILGDFEKLP
jgi:hypothetical protein